jgi:uncharacterized protein (DUF2235 family)
MNAVGRALAFHQWWGTSMKRLALFLDGTWNKVESRTNVSRLHDLVADRDGTIRQCRYYEEGVGTKRLEWLRGGALGYGLSQGVVVAYEWLVENFDEGDEIFIFGFSRGAYSARSLAGLIAKCGLLRRQAALTPKTLYHRYQLSDAVRPIWTLDYVATQGGDLTEEERALLTASRRVPIRMVAVWDTVGALGVPFGNIPGLSRSRYLFHHTRLSNIFEHAYHALALDEHREAFEPTLWTRFVPKVPDQQVPGPRHQTKVEQRWFVGAHADVGGGNPTTLPEVALAWLAGKASEAGLRMTVPPSLPAAAFRGPITDSYGAFMFGIYKLLKGGRDFVRTIAAPRVEKERGWVETVAETIDESVFDRYRADESYRPAGLAAWSHRLKVDPASIKGTVDARTGKSLAEEMV